MRKKSVKKARRKQKDNFIMDMFPVQKEDFNIFDFNLLDFNIFDFNSIFKTKPVQKKNTAGRLDINIKNLEKIQERNYNISTKDYLGAASRNYTYSSGNEQQENPQYSKTGFKQTNPENIVQYNSMYNKGTILKNRYRGFGAECADRRNDRMYLELKMDHPNKKQFDAIRDKLHQIFNFFDYNKKI